MFRLKANKTSLYKLVGEFEDLPPMRRVTITKAYRAPDWWLKWTDADGLLCVAFFSTCTGKAMLSMLIAWLLFREKYPEAVHLLEMYAGLGTVLGHNFPFYMKFKGGKGIACTAGFLLTFYPPLAVLCLLVFVVTVAATRYVSLGSILVSLCFYIQLLIFGQMGHIRVNVGLLPEIYAVGAVFTILAIWRHRANVKRLLTGTENKISVSKSGDLKKNS